MVDAHVRLEKRERAIALFKMQPGYLAVTSREDDTKHPTPRVDIPSSKRGWEYQFQLWKNTNRRMHHQPKPAGLVEESVKPPPGLTRPLKVGLVHR